MQEHLRNVAAALLLAAGGAAQGALLETSFTYDVTSYNDGMTRNTTALVTRRDDLGAERRPVILAMPGWDGLTNVPAGRDSYTTLYANNGYVVVNIGFHYTGAYFSSDLAESAKAALETACGAAFVDCTAVVLTGISYGATQTHPVLRFLRANGVFDGSAGANAGRRVVGFLAQDAGYTLHYANPVNADATAYSIAMIENQGDADFPIDACDFDNCGARNRGDYHQGAAGSQYVLSYCPPGGSHGTHAGQWDTWVLSAMKTMIHNHRGVPKFTGYVEPSLAPINACVTVAAGLQTTTALASGTNPSAAGQSVTFTATVTSPSGGAPTGTVTFKDGSTPICSAVAIAAGQAQCATSGLSVATHSITAEYSGDAAYLASISNALSQAVVAPDSSSTPRLGNISTRGQVLTSNDVMIGGFVIGGSSNKTVVVRARGPSLVPFGITNALMNPHLQLVRSSDQATLVVNDDWGSAVNAAAISSSGFAPSDSRESAILINLPPGAYTAIVSGVGGTTGVGIIEVFELDHPEIPLANISTRGRVFTGNDVMIGGFVINGSASQTVVVRARGPSLVPFGITNALMNPHLQLVRSSDQVSLATNDDWGTAGNAAALSASGFAPSDSRESAILITLPPGAYTAIVSGVGGTTGVAIVEVFAQ